jgi:hypothetical protein
MRTVHQRWQRVNQKQKLRGRAAVQDGSRDDILLASRRVSVMLFPQQEPQDEILADLIALSFIDGTESVGIDGVIGPARHSQFAAVTHA